MKKATLILISIVVLLVIAAIITNVKMCNKSVTKKDLESLLRDNAPILEVSNEEMVIDTSTTGDN